MAKERKEEKAPEELLVLHERWVDFAKRHIREIIIAAIAIVVVVAAWSGFTYYQQQKTEKAALLLVQGLMTQDQKQRENIYQQVIKKYGNTPAALEARLALFEEYYAQGKLSEATSELEKVASKAKGDLKYFSSLGLGYLKEEQKKYPEAEKLYEKAATAKIGLEKVAYWDLSRVAELQNKLKEAVKYYEKLVALKPEAEKLTFIQVKLERLSQKLEKID
ncbi:YfgM family protein [Thermodesulfatator autotrophicus]|uniref:Ancillary SecYEG translocon subunit/Cell division coordinator CpoB TPR domain-containing protein n=1 Tax=Thermodesulfatator autotrophicus TaxID=1795632 RepID=A0A177E8N6_9BACT|nr:tetratricopeptide repeat protein [Thermodesulfatator autotrophicus]OAG27780.1 hypothetical protein TH606_05340 [Thermodesulfatator autotrophicus]